MNTWLKILWFAARQVADGRLPHLRVDRYPFDTWFVRWYRPLHTIPDDCPWPSDEVIPF